MFIDIVVKSLMLFTLILLKHSWSTLYIRYDIRFQIIDEMKLIESRAGNCMFA